MILRQEKVQRLSTKRFELFYPETGPLRRGRWMRPHERERVIVRIEGDDMTALPATAELRAGTTQISPEPTNGAPTAVFTRTRRLAVAPLYLNSRWRVTEDRLQWVLEYKARRPNSRTCGWEGRRFCMSRRCLLDSIREKCGPVNAAALAEVEGWPKIHPGFAAYGGAMR